MKWLKQIIVRIKDWLNKVFLLLFVLFFILMLNKAIVKKGKRNGKDLL